MGHHADILLGLDAGTTRLAVVAFTTAGREIAHAALAVPAVHGTDGSTEQNQGEAWQGVVTVLRRLGQRVPNLARRTLALALTGPAGGCWLSDEDGDAVAPAMLPSDGRAAALVAGWRATGAARAIARSTGVAPDASSSSAQLAWLASHRPRVLDQAASAFCGKDWLYACLTGERVAEASAGLGVFGNLENGAYDGFLLERLGLQEIARLLPAIVDGTRHHGRLAPAAAAALGLAAGTPVVPGPVDGVACGVAAGLGGADPALVASDLGPGGPHVGAWPQRPPGDLAERGVALRAFGGLWFGLVAQPANRGPMWLLGLAEELLADAGLIGVPRAELEALLERKARAAAPGRACWQTDEGGDGWSLTGLSAATSFYDLLRASQEAIGRAAQASYRVLDRHPQEVRLLGASPPAAATLAMVGAPVRVLARAAPAATGAALTAAVNLGIYPDLATAERDWVAPFLEA